MIDNHGHIAICEPRPDEIVEGYDPNQRFGGPHEKFLSLMDAVGVETAVLHCPRPWANRFYARVVREHPGRFISVCRTDESRATTAEQCEVLRTCIEDLGFAGLYYDPGPGGTDASDNFYSEAYWPFWKLAVSLRIPVCLVSLRGNFETLWPNALKLLEKFPELPVVIVHGLYPACILQADGSVVIPDSARRLVRDYDVYLDLLAGLREGQYGPKDESLKVMFDTFGPTKLMWGSEFTKVATPTVEQYSYQARYVEQRCGYMSKDDLHLIHGGNARRVYGLA